MKKLSAIFYILLITVSCAQEIESIEYANSITSNDLENLLSVYSSDDFEGRQRKAFEIYLGYNTRNQHKMI